MIPMSPVVNIEELDRVWNLAKKEANSSKMRRFQLGAVLVNRGKIISSGRNMHKTHPIFGSGEFKTMHAEGFAIYKAILNGISPAGSIMYVYRKNGLKAKPCVSCEFLLKKFGIQRVLYSDE